MLQGCREYGSEILRFSRFSKVSKTHNSLRHWILGLANDVAKFSMDPYVIQESPTGANLPDQRALRGSMFFHSPEGRLPQVKVFGKSMPVEFKRCPRIKQFPSFFKEFAYPLLLFSVTKIPHACNRFRETNTGMTTLGARTIGNSKMKENPGSFIQ